MVLLKPFSRHTTWKTIAVLLSTSSRLPLARSASSNANAELKSASDEAKSPADPSPKSDQPAEKKKNQAELDRDLEMKMQDLAGDGGEAGVELEDGQPVAMKRSVRNNMFRYI